MYEDRSGSSDTPGLHLRAWNLLRFAGRAIRYILVSAFDHDPLQGLIVVLGLLLCLWAWVFHPEIFR